MKSPLALLLALLLCGCASAPKHAPFVEAQHQQALLRWQKKDKSLVAEAVFSRSNSGATRLQLVKGTPQVLLQVTLEADNYVAATGPLARLGWRGHASEAPLGLLTWVKLVEDYRTSLSWPDGKTELHSANTRTAIEVANSRPVSISVINDVDGETVTVNFK